METRRKSVASTAGIVSKVIVTALLAAAPTMASGGTPRAVPATKPRAAATVVTVTDANVAERVLAARTKSDQKALAAYYKAKAAGEDERIAHFDQLLHAYMKLEGKQMQPLQRHARALLKAARLFKQRYELLAQAHLNLSYEQD